MAYMTPRLEELKINISTSSAEDKKKAYYDYIDALQRHDRNVPADDRFAYLEELLQMYKDFLPLCNRIEKIPVSKFISFLSSRIQYAKTAVAEKKKAIQ